jgi:hypothetical protein
VCGSTADVDPFVQMSKRIKKKIAKTITSDAKSNLIARIPLGSKYDARDKR